MSTPSTAEYKRLQREHIDQACMCNVCGHAFITKQTLIKKYFMKFTPRPTMAVCGRCNKFGIGNKVTRKNKKEHAIRRKAERKLYKKTVLIPKWRAKHAD